MHRAILLPLPCLLLACWVATSPGQEKPPTPPALRLTDQQLHAAAANIDQAWEQIRHAAWIRDAEHSRKNAPREPVKPEAPPPPAASDEQFLRRATLDATGLIPTEAETRAFLSDPLPDKRHRLVDRLLLEPGWGRRQFNRYADLFRLRDMVGETPQAGYIAFVRLAAETNLPFDEFVRSILTASGNLADNPATGFLLSDQGNLLLTMDHIAGGLLRADVHCAMCHDHPFNDMTQLQYYQLAACFGATQVTLRKPGNPRREIEVWPRDASRLLRLGDRGRSGLLTIRDGLSMGLRLGSDYRYKDGKPGDLVKRAVSYPVGKQDPKKTWTSPKHLRGEFAEWLVGSRRFADAAACAQMVALFGGEENPDQPAVRFGTLAPSSMRRDGSGWDCYSSMRYPTGGPRELLANDRDLWPEMIWLRRLLATLLQKVGFDLREFQRVLMHTEAYGREVSKDLSLGLPFFANASGPLLRRLSPEQIWDTLVMLGGIDGKEYRFASELPQTLPESHPLKILGRGDRVRGDDAVCSISPDLARLMVNSDLVRRISRPESALLSSVQGRFNHSPVRQAEALFLAILNRMPSERERAQAIGVMAAVPDGAGQVAGSLLNTSEFLFEH